MKTGLLSFFLCCLLACNHAGNYVAPPPQRSEQQTATFFQYNIWGAFVNRVFDGSMTVKELKEKGNIGLGSFDLLDGELVMLDGIVYRIRQDGSVSVGGDADEIIYADATIFNKDESFSTNGTLNYDSIRQVLNLRITSPNHFYAFKISGIFDSIVLGGLHKQTPPFSKGLDVLIPSRPVFRGAVVKGTMVGFYCPAFIGDINTAGYHFHFISDDKELGGHVMEVKATKQLKVEVQKLLNYEFRLPESKSFDTVQFDKQFQYNKK
jgi:acetolactate decarboxylase